MTSPDNDVRQRFIFEHSDVRGEILSLQDCYQAVLSKAIYPSPIAQLIGEFIAGACLLSATLKFDGIISLQASGTGPLSMIMADCSHHCEVRAVAHYKHEYFEDHQSVWNKTPYQLSDLLGENATLSVTIDPAQGERYQGLVPVENDTVGECLSNYFKQSEQLPTKIWLHADGQRAGGLLLQALPGDIPAIEDQQHYWQHLNHLAQTLSSAEQVQLSHVEQLHRLFHEESLRLFTPSDIRFACSCSRPRTENMLIGFGLNEVNAMLAASNPIEVRCQFCHELYRFGRGDVASLFKQSSPMLH